MTFSTLADVEAWAGPEIHAWSEWDTSAIKPEPFKGVANDQRSAAEEVLNSASRYLAGDQNMLSNLRSHMSRFAREEIVRSDTAWGAEILRLSKDSPTDAAAAIWAGAQARRELDGRDQQNWLSNSQLNTNLTRALTAIVRLTFARGAASPQQLPFAQALSAIEASLSNTQNQWRALAARSAKEWEDTKTRWLQEETSRQKLASEELSKFVEGRVEEIAGLEKLFREKIRLEAPVQYWKDKAKSHDVAVWVWGLLTAAVAIVPLWAAAYLAPDYFSTFREFQKDLSPGGIGVLLFFFVLYLMLARHVGRLYTTSLGLRNDASERVVMAQTFLALVQDSKLGDGERALVLAALFRNYAGGGDSDQATSVAEALAKAMTSK